MAGMLLHPVGTVTAHATETQNAEEALSAEATEKNTAATEYTEESETVSSIADLSAEEILYEGKDGYVTWCIDTDGVLYLEGNGNYCLYQPDWTEASYNESIKKAVVNVTGMTRTSEMFTGCRNMEEVEFVGFDASKVVYMDKMFYGCKSLKEMDLSDWDTSSLKNIEYMFAWCESLKKVNLSGWDISNVTSLEAVFAKCTSMLEVVLNGWETSKVTSVENTFYRCEKLKKMDIRTWDMSSVTNSYGMFMYAEGLTELYLPESISSMGAYFLEDTWNLRRLYIPSSITDVSKAVISENTIIICNEGSAAHQWAVEQGQKYSLLDHVHNYEGTVLKEATSGEKGIIKYECTATGCDEYYHMAYEYGHNIVTDSGKAATCIVAGLTEGSHCETCGKVMARQDTIPAAHKEVTDKAVEPTCTESGWTKGSHCSVCGEVLEAQEEIPANGHRIAVDEAVEATCTETGLTKGSHCSVCNETILAQKEIPAKGHVEVVDKAVEASCTETGLTEGSHCSDCETVLVAQKEVPAKGHTEVVTKGIEPTCTKGGTSDGIYCSVCDTVIAEQKELPAKGHTEVVDKAVESTCHSTGLTAGSHCSDCKKVIKAQKTVSKTDHNYKETIIKAAIGKNGSKINACTMCGKEKANSTIYAIKTIKLSKTAYTYNGKTRKPSVTIKDSKGNKLTKGTDYTVTYSKGCKKSGKYTVTVKFKGDYTGSKKLTYIIEPKSVSISKVSAKTKGFKVTWKKGTEISGYQIQYSTSKKFTKKTTDTVTIKNAKTTSKTISKLKAKKKYYVRIRAYKTVKVNGKLTKIYSDWSGVKKVTTKK